jgi:DNA-binding MarR family transcriptional regulator
MSSSSREFTAALEALMDSVQQQQRGVFREWKLTPVQFFVLRWLSKDDEANMSKLAGLLGVRPQTVTPIVDTLESSGWVRRVRSIEDRRESLLVLTPKGARMITSVKGAFFEKLGRALDEAPARSLRTSTRVLQVATAALRRDSRPPRAPRPRRAKA